MASAKFSSSFFSESDFVISHLINSQTTMADEDLSLNEDQLLDNLDDANGDLNEASLDFWIFSGH